MLHVHSPLGGSNEWVVLTYNLQVIGDYIKENSKLRKKLDLVVEQYVSQLEIYGGNMNPYPGDPSENPDLWKIMSRKLEALERRVKNLEELADEA